MRSTPDLPISSVFRPRRPLTIPPCDLPGNLGAKRDALAAVLATAAGVEPSAVALSIDGAAVSADITVPAEDADATRALLSEGLFARAKQFWVAAVQPVLPDGWLLMEQLHGRSYYYHEKSGASQFDKPDEEPDSESDPEDDYDPCYVGSRYAAEKKMKKQAPTQSIWSALWEGW